MASLIYTIIIPKHNYPALLTQAPQGSGKAATVVFYPGMRLLVDGGNGVTFLDGHGGYGKAMTRPRGRTYFTHGVVCRSKSPSSHSSVPEGSIRILRHSSTAILHYSPRCRCPDPFGGRKSAQRNLNLPNKL